jgi:hypothetical protein
LWPAVQAPTVRDRFISGGLHRILFSLRAIGNCLAQCVLSITKGGSVGLVRLVDSRLLIGNALIKKGQRHGRGQNLPNGTGTLAFRSGQVYSGGFKDGRFQGEGWITYANGRMEHGNYIQSKREGHFILRTPDGKRWKEFFVADERKSVTRLETPAQDKVTNRGAFAQQLDDSRIPIGLKVKGFGDNTDLPRLGIEVGDVLQELCDIRMAMTLDYQRADRILQAKEKPCTVKVLRKGLPLTLNDIHEPSKS